LFKYNDWEKINIQLKQSDRTCVEELGQLIPSPDCRSKAWQVYYRNFFKNNGPTELASEGNDLYTGKLVA